MKKIGIGLSVALLSVAYFVSLLEVGGISMERSLLRHSRLEESSRIELEVSQSVDGLIVETFSQIDGIVDHLEKLESAIGPCLRSVESEPAEVGVLEGSSRSEVASFGVQLRKRLESGDDQIESLRERVQWID